MKKPIFFFHLIVLLWSTSYAQDAEPSQLYLAAGLTYPQIQTEAQFRSNLSSINRSLQLERDLNLERDPRLLYLKAILGSRFSIGLSCLRVARSAEGQLQTDLTISDSVYTIGAATRAYFNTTFYSASLRLNLVQTPIVTAGLSAGGRYLQVESGIHANSLGNVFDRTDKFSVPLFMPGVYASIWLPPGFILRGSVDYFKTTIRNTTASAIEATAAAEFYPVRFIGIGAALTYLDLNASSLPDNTLQIESISYSIKGLSIYGVFRF